MSTVAHVRVPGVDEAQLRSREIRHDTRSARRLTALILSWRSVLLAALLVGWYYASGRIVDSLFVSNPVAVARSFGHFISTGQLGLEIRYTAIEIAIGYASGVIVGIGAAIVLSLSATLERVMQPYLMAIYAMPTIALSPLIVIWFGFGLTPKVIIAGLFVFFVVFMMTMSGIRSVERQLINVALVMGADRRQLMTKIILPSAVPNIITALRVAIPEAVVGVIIGEFIGGLHGVGYLVEEAAQQYNTAGVFAAIASILIIVLILDGLLTLVERWLLRWRPATPS
jgi:NitT/TauT family transport system permease protein